MKVPYTIPKTILRAYTQKLNEAALKKSYEGRLLISEDPTWDKDLPPTLAEQCLDLVLDEFLFYNKLVEYFNGLKLQDYEQRKAKWEKDLSEYLQKKEHYDQRLIDYESGTGDIDYDDFDDDDPDHPKVDSTGKPIEPEKVDDDFPEYEPVPNILDHLKYLNVVFKDWDRIHIIEEIELDLIPFPLAVKIIPDDYYWERQARDRWQVFDINDHNKSWRRMYMEKHAWDAIERFHPADDDIEKLKEDLQLVGPEVIRLHIQNIIPICFGTPATEVVPQTFEGDNGWGPDDEFDVGFGDGEMFQDPDDQGVAVSEDTVKSLTSKKKNKKQDNGLKSKIEADYITPEEKRNPEMDRKDSSHLDFSQILPIFTNLKEMTIVYEMVETGLDWEARFFKFTDTDCINLAKALAEASSLEKFELLRSHVTGEQCKTLIREGILKMPHLKHLNLNYNRIGDVGARAVARLLIDEKSHARHTIHTVRVARNRIHNAGGKALAFALTKNAHLSVLDARLNSFGDAAGCDFGHALVKNASLLALFLGGNKMGEESAYVLGKMLFHNKSIRELDVSSNDLGKKGGEFLALGMRNNKTILRLDVRLCNIGLDFVYDVGTHLRKNRNRISASHSIVDGDDYYPRETESVVLDLEEIPTDESEDETGDEGELEEMDDEEDEEEEEMSPEAIVLTGTKQKEKAEEKNAGGLTAAMLVNAGLMSYAQAQAALNDPRIAAALARAMEGPKTVGKKIEKETVRKTRSRKVNNNKELKVIKTPQNLKRSNHAFDCL